MNAAAAIKINPKIVSGGLLAASGVLLLGDCFYTVQGGHRAVIFSKLTGVVNRVRSEGLHLKIPFLHSPTIFDVRTKAQTLNSATGSKDLQIVNVSLRILSRPRIEALPSILQTLGTNYDQKVLPSIGNEVLKCVVAQFNASQLITMRQQVSVMIKEQLTERSKDFNIIIEDIAIVDMTFGREYTQAIEAKQIAQQEAQRAMFVVEQAVQEKQQKIVQAEGEAKSVTLLGEAVRQNPGYLKLRRIRAAQKIATIIADSPNKMYLDASSLMLNLTMLNDSQAN